MARIESETVYNVELDEDEAARLANGGSVTLDLPTGDTIRLDGVSSNADVSTGANDTPSAANDEAAEEVADDDTSLEEIEQLVRKSEKEARENRGPDSEDVPDEEDRDDDEGNSGGGGIISVERGQ